jgi:phosphinothricin acetyltransferase
MRMPAVQNRPASRQDCNPVAELYAGYVRNSLCTLELVPPSPEEWGAKLAYLVRVGLPFLVATDEQQLLGFDYLSPWRSKPGYHFTVEDSVYVDPSHVRRGVGRRLLTDLFIDARSWGARQVIAVIADTGEPASLALHHSLGFQEVGRLPQVGFKLGRWVDTRLLQLSLGDPEAQS